jgi:type 1 fimbria pilin
MKRIFMAAAVALALGSVACAASAATTATVTFEGTVTSNTCQITNQNVNFGGDTVTDVAGGTANYHKVNIQLTGCAATASGVDDPNIEFAATSGQLGTNIMSLKDASGGTNTALTLWQDAGTTQINPQGGHTITVPTAAGGVQVPLYVKLIQDGTAQAGAYSGSSVVNISY